MTQPRGGKSEPSLVGGKEGLCGLCSAVLAVISFSDEKEKALRIASTSLTSF